MSHEIDSRLESAARATLAALSLGLCLTVTTSAQELLYELRGEYPEDHFGTAVSGVGDVNGDGFADFAVGAPRADFNGVSSGRATVFCGASGRVLYTFDGDAAYSSFGTSIACAGDVDMDGFADIVIGGLRGSSAAGTARVISGRTGSVRFTLSGLTPDDWFGYSVAGVGDVNLDGYSDVVVGAPYDQPAGRDSGSARVFSGFDGSVLYHLTGTAPGDRLGYAVGGGEDVDGDGVPEIVVGAPYGDTTGTDAGTVWVYSGRNGAPLHELHGQDAHEHFGSAVAVAGDADRDGLAEVVIGAPDAVSAAGMTGAARVVNGADGSLLYLLTGFSDGEEFGFAVSGAGDFDGDGFADFLIGGPAATSAFPAYGAARVFSGRLGALVHSTYNKNYDARLGQSVSWAGDVNDDGLDDIIIGAPLDDSAGTDAGRVIVLGGSLRLPELTFRSHTELDTFGKDLSVVGDVNGDATPDIVISAPYRSRAVRVYSGHNGSVVHEIVGGSYSFGFAVGGGDVNADGLADIFVGAPSPQSVYVYSGLDASLLYRLTTLHSSGISVAYSRDLNGDGYGDILVGEYGYGTGYSYDTLVYSGKDHSRLFIVPGGNDVDGMDDVNGDGYLDLVTGDAEDGVVRAASGQNGAILWQVQGPPRDSIQFGYSVAALGDVNADGISDIAVGAPNDTLGGSSSGSVWLLSGSDGSTIRSLGNGGGGDGYGRSVSAAGDIDGDGCPDILVGSLNEYAQLRSGATGTKILELRYPDHDHFGMVVDGTHDIDGDGYHELAIAAPDDDEFAYFGGTAWVFSGNLDEAMWKANGSAWPGTLGPPRLTASDDPKLCTSIRLDIQSSLDASTPAVLLIGLSDISLPTAWLGRLWVMPVSVVPVTLPPGESGMPLEIPCDPVLLGVSVFVQLLEVDPGAVRGVASSKGLELRLGH
ncbi:MAG: FG-GAP-like repeat-containing protein [Planctomycetota bacterium]